MARGDDAGNLKTAVVVWVDELFGPSDPPLKPNSKEERGLDNDNTGQLLCPGEYQWEDIECVPCLGHCFTLNQFVQCPNIDSKRSSRLPCHRSILAYVCLRRIQM
jgi:hypothetical protein